MKKMKLVLVAAAFVVAVSAQATPYNITFSGSGWTANGQVDVTGGTATSGYLDVTYGLTTVNYGYLAIGPLNAIVSNNNGDNLPYGDNLVDVNATYFVDQYGLLFLTAPIVGNHTDGAGVYLSADQNNGNVPNLNGYGNAPGFGWGVPNVDGQATISPASTSVPDGASTVVLLGVSLIGLVGVGKKLKPSDVHGSSVATA